MEITYPGPHASVDIPGARVARGETVDLPDKVAKSLLGQGWERAGDGPDKPTRKTKHKADAAEED